MASNSTGFALSAGMAAIVVLIGYTLLNAASLVGFAAEPVPVVELPSDVTLGWCGTSALTQRPLLNLTPDDAKLAATGDALFKGNCAQCHAVNDKVVGPALAGITKRRPMSWLIPWVKNSSKVVASGDAYAVKLFNEYQKQQMPSFDLSEQEIKAIVTYIETQGYVMASTASIVD